MTASRGPATVAEGLAAMLADEFARINTFEFSKLFEPIRDPQEQSGAC
jgi:hypothetical protein